MSTTQTHTTQTLTTHTHKNTRRTHSTQTHMNTAQTHTTRTHTQTHDMNTHGHFTNTHHTNIVIFGTSFIIFNFSIWCLIHSKSLRLVFYFNAFLEIHLNDYSTDKLPKHLNICIQIVSNQSHQT